MLGIWLDIIDFTQVIKRLEEESGIRIWNAQTWCGQVIIHTRESGSLYPGPFVFTVEILLF
jgi:hypothetical protein